MTAADDLRRMGAALALARRGRGRTGANPNVGAMLWQGGRVVGRGWTRDGGRPHAEAMALAEAGALTHGATLYTTLEPCAHQSARGPDCTGLLIAAGIARAVVAMPDPDPRTAGRGLARLRAAGIAVSADVGRAAAAAELQGFAGRIEHGRPQLTLKLALSIDGRLALASGASQWITGPPARAFAHALRAESDLVVVGHGTVRADQPQLTARIAGSSAPQPIRGCLGRAGAPAGWQQFASITALDAFAAAHGCNRILCEGGGGAAAALLAADRVDRLIVLRAPIIVGAGIGLEQLPLADLGAAHGRWQRARTRALGVDLLEVYARRR